MITLEGFAEAHGLELLVQRFSDLPPDQRYCVRIPDAEVKTCNLLLSAVGWGESEEIAAENYRIAISGRLLVLNAYREDRLEIRVPSLAPSYPEGVPQS